MSENFAEEIAAVQRLENFITDGGAIYPYPGWQKDFWTVIELAREYLELE